jgi:hypothetical protein
MCTRITDSPGSRCSFTPPSGLALNSTTVLVTGGQFVSSTNASCRFGDVVVPAAVVSFAQLQCLAPPLLDVAAGASRAVPFAVSLDGAQWATTDTPFTYIRCSSDCNVSAFRSWVPAFLIPLSRCADT